MTSELKLVTEAWRERLRTEPGRVAISYLGSHLTVAEVEELSEGIAAVLQQGGVGPGDVVGVVLQNSPQYVLTMLAAWRLGATLVSVNPMYQEAEVRHVLTDSGSVGLVCDVRAEAAERVATELGIAVWLTSPAVLQERHPADYFGPTSSLASVDDLVVRARAAGARLPWAEIGGDDCALLTYTSGTTGPPKGAMNTHRAIAASVDAFALAAQLDRSDVMLAMAPMFHITGSVINALVALSRAVRLVLIDRFTPESAREAFVDEGVTISVAAITAYTALARAEGTSPECFRSVRTLYSGGAPVSPAAAARMEERLGHYVHNIYGMTETTSAVVAVPDRERAPTESSTGVLSVGRAMRGVTLRVLDDQGQPLPRGVAGELEVRGPSVVPGYWRNPEATATTFVEGALRTGDVAVIDEQGWVFIIDRLKDQINTSGYKVWPREVEEALCGHDDVVDAAVVGRPDEYRGERVVAFVVPAGPHLDVDELLRFVRDRLAAFKVPREVEVVDRLPTTASGKVQRRVLREEPK